MNKILIVIPSFKHGGTNRSLWNLMNSRIGKSYDISILAMEHNGAYKEKFSRFKIVNEDILLGVRASIGNYSGLRKIKVCISKLIFNLIFKNDIEKLYRIAARKYDKEDYDIVVAFQEGAATEFASFISAKKHIAWVRCDYSNYLRLANKQDELNIYEKYNRIVCVSYYTSNVFRNHYLQLSDRIIAIHNIIDTGGIIEDSKKEDVDKRYINDLFTIVSVGRIDKVKRFAKIPIIAKKMLDNACIFKWYIIGDGGTEENNVRMEILKCAVQDTVIMLGAKENPYPYISNSSLLVCLSQSEACPNVVNEAKILHTPVVCTDFPSVYEYIEDGINGIVSPIDNLSDVLVKLCREEECYKVIADGISDFIYDNNEIQVMLQELFSI